MKSIAIAAVVAAVVSVGFHLWQPSSVESTVTQASQSETAYDRVMRTNTIRCGYSVWPPHLGVDDETGEFYGIFYDYVAALAESIGMSVKWAEESDLASFIAGLEARRFDVYCPGLWPEPHEARQIDFTKPITYQPLYAWVRHGDFRFDDDIAKLNSPAITVSGMDGEISLAIADVDFPRAKRLELPALANPAQMLLNVSTGKADVVFTNLALGLEFQVNNPKTIRRVPSKPLRIYGETLAVLANEHKLRRLLNNATQALINDGTIQKIVSKHEPVPGAFTVNSLNVVID